VNHAKIRFNILLYLYQKHYSHRLGHEQPVDEIIGAAGLSNIDRSAIYGDVIYLNNRDLLLANAT
jgi:hypothetical protein